MKSAFKSTLAIAAAVMMLSSAQGADDKKSSEPVKAEKSPTAQAETQVVPVRTDYSVYSDVAKSAALAGEQINWQVIASGGNSSSSTSYKLNGTVGQTAVGMVSSTSFGLNQGFWQTFSAGAGCCTLRGDVDGSSALNVSDLTYLVSYLFQGGPAAPCPDHADVDSSNAINVSDLTFLVAYLFQGGPTPGAC